MIIKTRSYPRAALLGNPSDGYNGKTLAFPFSNFTAEVVLYETPELEILPAKYDSNVFNSIRDLAEDVKLYGYYGGVRLLKAAVKTFYDYAIENGIDLDERNFTIRYSSNIPYRLGLAGSSAIITACIKALKSFYGVNILKPVMANLVLSVEVDELDITAGLQDRVVQAFESPVYMDFNKELMDKQGYGKYQKFTSQLLDHLYIAYRTDLSEGSEVVHNDFRERYNFGDEKVHQAIKDWIQLTDLGYKALKSNDLEELSKLINKNFDIRNSVMNLSSKNLQMVELARSAGASAKFSGSGGAIVGTYSDEAMFNSLKNKLQKHKITIIKPRIIQS
ncbi:MAG: GHMP kinase [Bacteroidales bacterium]|nr:GHMP kinase [Bacteroidales bacterium]